MKEEKVTLDISFNALLKILVVVLGVIFIYAIRDIVVDVFIVLVFVASLSPIIKGWSKSMPRPLALTLMFALIISVICLIIYLIVPPLVGQLQGLTETLQSYFTGGSSRLTLPDQYVNIITGQIDKIGSALSNGIFKTTTSVINGFIAFITILVLTFYLLADQSSFTKFILEYLPINRKEQIIKTLGEVGEKMGLWLRGQLTLMVIIGLIDGLIVMFLGVPYALALGLWAGLTEAIPYIGPLLGMIAALVVAFATTGNIVIPLIILVSFMLVQQLEAHFLVPNIMGKAVGLSPVIIILAVLIGGKLFGLTGIILAVPAAATLAVLIKEWPKLKY